MVAVEDGSPNCLDVESKGLEERHRVLTLDLLEHDSELVVGNFFDKVTLELDDDVVTGEDRAESVPLVAEETKAVAFQNDGVIKPGFNGCLSRHNREVRHVFESLVADLHLESELVGVRVDFGWSHLLKFDFGLQLLNSFLDHRVGLVKNVDDKLGSVESESVCCWVVGSKLR